VLSVAPWEDIFVTYGENPKRVRLKDESFFKLPFEKPEVALGYLRFYLTLLKGALKFGL
jgi:hypothetical protein